MNTTLKEYVDLLKKIQHDEFVPEEASKKENLFFDVYKIIPLWKRIYITREKNNKEILVLSSETGYFIGIYIAEKMYISCPYVYDQETNNIKAPITKTFASDQEILQKIMEEIDLFKELCNCYAHSLLEWYTK